MPHLDLDKTDIKILAALQQNGRLTNVELADAVALSPSPCLRRLKHLEESGIVQRYVALLDPARIRSCRSFRAFDDQVTAPLHGFAGVDDYWARASANPWLSRIVRPTLVLNAGNDPFLPAHALPGPEQASAAGQIGQQVERVASTAEAFVQRAQQSAHTADALLSVVTRLDGEVAHFQV